MRHLIAYVLFACLLFAGTPVAAMAAGDPMLGGYPAGFTDRFQLSLNRPLTVLLLGTDVVYAAPGRKSRSPDGRFRGRSDVMMLVRCDPANQRIAVVQIPRDSLVRLQGNRVRKINAANRIGGPQLAQEAVASLLGVKPDYYLVMPLDGLVALVDALGGISLSVPKRLKYTDRTAGLNIDLQPGLQTLSGRQAAGFVRFRHDGRGDIGRLPRQKIFLEAFLDRVKGPTTWQQLFSVIGVVATNVRTNIPIPDMVRGFLFARYLPRSRIQFASLPGRGSGTGNWLVDRTATRALMHRMTGPVSVAAEEPAKPL